jgi:sec-independent protein translocase protein TatA
VPLVLQPRHRFAYSSGTENPDMFGLGIGELLVILVIVLVIFGAGKLPEIGDGLGRSIRNFRKSVKAPDEIDITPKKDDDTKNQA